MLKDFFGEPIPKKDDVILEYENIFNYTPKRSKFNLDFNRKDLHFKNKKELIVQVVEKPKRGNNGRKSKK